jgi:LemA protein
MPGQKFKLIMFCFVFTSIIAFCVIFGGYSSFWRAQNRISDAKNLMAQICQERLTLADIIIKDFNNAGLGKDMEKPRHDVLKAADILKNLKNTEPPLSGNQTRQLEDSQADITQFFKTCLKYLKLPVKNISAARARELSTRIYEIQDKLFVAAKSYNDEVNYYNTRTREAMPSLIAKMFGFDKIHYIPAVMSG